MPRTPVTVELLHTPACGQWRTVFAAAQRVAAETGIAVTVTEVLVDTPEKAQALRFVGSPTVRVDGRDVQPEAEDRTDYGPG
jgi:K+-transporting ATPase c subunit